ncbi:hypothetical protein IE53DRAFT_380269 [Violaceomyces palustris]|uniref:Uncharacterized protein n=1 Tax=Violaceomyces palustris TaxID=1673888 RepID=A0ACD0NVI8_9BASI|nr:hypothetical protein IE53DRAFT_380269 [Violaceomyces palustris]
MRQTYFLLPLLLFPTIVSIAHTLINPYTKVEESFTLQAVHDILFFGLSPQSLESYDHLSFPGAVPRSFIPPILLSFASYPVIVAGRLLGLVQDSSHLQTAVRLTLGIINSVSLVLFGWSAILRGRWESGPVGQVDNDVDPKAFNPPSAVSTSVRSSSDHVKARSKKTAEIPEQGGTEDRGVSGPNRRRMGSIFAYYLLLTSFQFHINFWSSRTVPNSLVLPLVLYSVSELIASSRSHSSSKGSKRAIRRSISTLVFSSCVFRSELAGMLIPACLWALVTSRISILDLLFTGVISGLLSAISTILVDTYFWRDYSHLFGDHAMSSSSSVKPRVRPIWPELEAILFNVVQGKSKEWGTQPFHSYFTVHLPKLLTLSLPLLLVGASILFRRSLTISSTRMGKNRGGKSAEGNLDDLLLLILLPLGHVLTLSLLGHKEWRFIMYCLPLLNVISSIGAEYCFSEDSRCTGKPDESKSKGWNGHEHDSLPEQRAGRKAVGSKPFSKAKGQRLPSRVLVLGKRSAPWLVLILTLAITSVLTLLSHSNYPGGVALKELHQRVVEERRRTFGFVAKVKVHVSTLPAMTGVSLFQSLNLEAHLGPRIPGGAFGSVHLPPLLPMASADESSKAWDYSKQEKGWEGEALPEFDLLLTDSPECRVGIEIEGKGKREEGGGNGSRFSPLGEAIKGFGGIRIKSPKLWLKRDLLGSLLHPWKALADFERLLPFEVIMEDMIWLCAREQASVRR